MRSDPNYYVDGTKRAWESHFPSANTAAVVTITGTAAEFVVIDEIAFGYDAIPTGGLLTIEDGTTTIQVPVTESGPHAWAPREKFSAAAGADVTITLDAGGAGVTGYLNVHKS